MKYKYFVVSIKENNKLYAYVIKTSKNDNILYKINVKNVQFVLLADTKKEAYQIAASWNDSYKKNNNYLFSDTF